jgi:hypothetical protein
LKVGAQRRERIDRPAEPTELLLQELARERPLLRVDQRHRRRDFDPAVRVVARAYAQRLAEAAARLDVDRHPAPRLARERRAQPLLELRILRLEDARAGLDLREVGPVRARELQLDEPRLRGVASAARGPLRAAAPTAAPRALRWRRRRHFVRGDAPADAHFEDRPALLARLRIGTFEHDAVSAPQRRLEREHRARRRRIRVRNPAEEDAALLGIAPLDQSLMVHAFQESVRESARETLLEVPRLALAERDAARLQRLVERAPVGRGHVGDVLRRLEPPLDLERTHARPQQLRQQVERREVLRRKQVPHRAELPSLAVDDQVVRHAARLRALAAIGGAAAPDLARQALARPAHAERAVHEDLELEVGPLVDARDLLDRQLARQDRAHDPEPPRELAALGRRDRHLRRGVQRQPRHDLLREPRDAEVLHDRRVRARLVDPAQLLARERQLLLEDERVERDVALHAAPVQLGHHCAEAVEREVGRASARVESVLQPEVDRVGAVLDGGAQALEVAGRSEDLGTRRLGCGHGSCDFVADAPRSGREGRAR